jgi:hypothetical protein
MGPREQQPNQELGEDTSAPLPALATREAANEIGKGLSERFTRSVDNTGKALAVVAGFGVFFYAAGYFVEWQRFRRGGLPPEEVLALLPRGQIAAAGVKELFISLVFGGALLATLGWGLVSLARRAQGNDSLWARVVNRLFSRELLFPTLLVGGLTLLIVPLDKAGAIVSVILTALFFCMLLLLKRFVDDGDDAEFPLWQLLLAVGLAAIVLTGARQWEYPEARPEAIVYLTGGRTLEGAYVASDSDKILIRRAGSPPQLTVFSEGKVARLRLRRSTYAFKRDPSLVGKAIDALFGADLNFSCIPPECRWASNTRFGPSSAF